ncbi:MAG TPA: peptidoglycan DD-metalloendopeptidase family protein [Pseudonocardiaceae bacterium]
MTKAETEVNVLRGVSADTPDGWAFGAAVALAPRRADAYPEGWLFVGHRVAGTWTVAFEGDAAFPVLTALAPAELLSSYEKKNFADYRPAAETKQPRLDAKPTANGDFRTGMRLPYALGQSWRLTGGPHGAARQSIDLAGGDGRVLAARAGTFYVMCSSNRGWVRVVHDRGYATDYYHLHNNRTGSGGVAEGTFLGNIGVDVSCGGSASGPHNHFSLRQNGVNVGIAAHSLGRWQVYNGAAEYQGYALHGSAQAGVGGSMYNYGALGFTQGVVDTNGGGVLNKRSGPGTNHGVVGTVADGATVTISCSANGTSHTGRFDYTTSMWNRLTDGSWISDAYTWTGTGNPVNGWC